MVALSSNVSSENPPIKTPEGLEFTVVEIKICLKGLIISYILFTRLEKNVPNVVAVGTVCVQPGAAETLIKLVLL